MSFTGWSNSNKVRLSSGLITAVPLSISCAYYASSLGSFKTLVSLCNSGAAQDRNLFALKVTSANQASAEAATGAGIWNGASSTSVVAGWNFVAGVWTSSTSRSAFVNGGGKGTGTNSATPSSINRLTVGSQDNAGSGQPTASGDRIAEVGVWNVALSDDEIAALGKGISPLLVRPQNLVAYLPLIRGLVDPKGNAFAVVGSLSAADHTTIYGVN